MNRDKSYAPYAQYLKPSICLEFQVQSTSDLGVYLGVPLMHGRMKKTHFKDLLEKAGRNLQAEKLSFYLW